ncbi:hypothetical protein AO262_03385 [Pseudomonas fluorescens ABAC62]|nr:hypothetical protein AO262_03385 [Pseudomonas fluorescens ABAC62]
MKVETGLLEDLNMKGSFSATITGAYEHLFKADLNRSQAYRELDGSWFLAGVQVVAGPKTHVIRLELPEEFSDDGQKQNYSIQTIPGEGIVTAFVEVESGTRYIATSGTVDICLENGNLTASFNLVAERGDKQVVINDGNINLQLGHGRFAAKLYEGADKQKEFNGQIFDIYKTKNIEGKYKFFTRAQMIVQFPYSHTVIAIVVNENLPSGTHKLDPSKTEAMVIYTQMGHVGSLVAHSGTLTIETVPKTGHSSGSFDCNFKPVNAAEFNAKGDFNIHYDVDD